MNRHGPEWENLREGTMTIEQYRQLDDRELRQLNKAEYDDTLGVDPTRLNDDGELVVEHRPRVHTVDETVEAV